MENDLKLMNKYDVMKEQLKPEKMRDIENLKVLGIQMVEKIELIDNELAIIKPQGVTYQQLDEDVRTYWMDLFKLKEMYYNQLTIIKYISNISEKVTPNSLLRKFEENGYDKKFLVQEMDI